MSPVPYPVPRDAVPPCRTRPELFFPPSGRTDLVEAAKHICSGCEFRDPCAAFAITRNVQGVWGKTSEKERKQARRARGIVARPLSFSEAAGIKRNTFGHTPSAHPGHGSWGGIGRHQRAGELLCDECRAFRVAYRKAKRDAKRVAEKGPRADSCALRACPDCGKEMRPKSLPKHIRTLHRDAS